MDCTKTTTTYQLGQRGIEGNLFQNIKSLRQRQVATLSYICRYSGEYRQITGTIHSVDPFWEILQIDNLIIDFSELVAISMC